MNDLQFARVNALPDLAQRTPNTVYFVANGATGIDIYVTGKSRATVRQLATSGGGNGVSAFADLTGKPTTLAGYGITDGATAASVALKANTADMLTALAAKANAAHAHTFVDLTETPTTLAGYGITDAATAASVALKASITDVLDALAAKAAVVHTHAFADITSKPTTLAGYGITDGATAASVLLKANITDVLNGLAGKADTLHTHAFADLTGKPTTVAGYGITDAVSTSSLSSAISGKADANAVVDLSTAQAVNGKKTLLREIVIANLLSDPSSLSAGMLWYNSTENAVKAYIGGQVTTLYRLTVGDPGALSAGVMFYDLLTDTLKLRKGSTTVTLSDSTHTHAFADLTTKPTTLVGYGITDVTGMLPVVPATSGTWAHLGEGRGAAGARAETANVMRMRPYVARATGSITSVAVSCSTAVASSLAKVAIYESGTDGKPTTLIAESADMDCSTTGVKTASISAVAQVAGRQYWVGVRVNSTQALNTDAASPRIDGAASALFGAPAAINRTVTYASAAPATWVWSASEILQNRDPWAVMGRYA